MVQLVPITRDNWREACRVRVADGQLPFVAGYEPVALVILAKALVRVADFDWWPFLLEDGGTPVGVVAVVDERQPHGQLAIFHLVVDRYHQRRGHGRAAVRALVELARDLDHCERLRLTVHPDNEAAIRLYQSEGFAFDGVDGDGEMRMSIQLR